MSPRKSRSTPAGQEQERSLQPAKPPPAGVDSSHHPFSPSVFGRLALCSRSHWLAEEARAQGLAVEPGDAADRGTVLHATLAALMLTGGRLVLDRCDLPREDVLQVERAIEYGRAVTTGANEILHEVRRTFQFNGEVLSFGTLDLEAYWEDGKLVVVDFKFGRSEPLSEILSWQLRCYGAMALQARPDATECKILVYHVPSRLEWHATIKREDLPALENAIVKVIRTVEASREAPPVPSAAACQYCPAKTICPALRAEVEGLMKTDYERALVPQLARALDFASIISTWAETVRKKAREVIKSGQPIPGWALRERRTRAVTDVLGARDAMHGVIDQGTFLEALECRLTALEELYVAAVRNRLPAKAAREELEAKLRAAGALEEGKQEYLRREGGKETDGNGE